MSLSPLQFARLTVVPDLPLILSDLTSIDWEKTTPPPSLLDPLNLEQFFSHTKQQPLLNGKKGSMKNGLPKKVGVVFSGGPAAGGHNVICGLFNALIALHPDSKLWGFLGGPIGILSGKCIELTKEVVFSYRNQGGFDLLGSGRTKIETDEQLKQALDQINKIGLDGLVIIGGDDSNTNAAILAEYFIQNDCQVKVIGVPKTIDGDLQNPYVTIPFGFDTACKIYSEMIGNIARDAASSKKYTHFIKLMGRSASHIALECALATHPNLTLISEEIKQNQIPLAQITTEIADLICERAKKGKNYSVILIPEGVIESIPDIAVLIRELNTLLAESKDPLLFDWIDQLTPVSNKCFSCLPEKIQQQLLLNRDPHGNVQVSLIETESLLMGAVAIELNQRKEKGEFVGAFHPVCHFLGYEGRAGFPTLFDSNYCYALGHVAALLIQEGHSGYMAYIDGLEKDTAEWGIGGVPLSSLIHIEIRQGQKKPVIKKALVDLKGKVFQSFKRQRAEWKLDDHYRFPGPIQFMGDSSLTKVPPFSLMLSQ